MNPFRRLKVAGLRALAKAVATYSLTDPAFGRTLGTTTEAGEIVSTDTAMKLSAVFGCVRILSETIGALPYSLYREEKSGSFTKVDDHPLQEVLTVSPNNYMTAVDLKETEIVNLCLSGNGYSYIDRRSDGSVLSLTPLESHRVTPRLKDSNTMEYKVLTNGKTEVYPQEKIWHIRGFGRNGIEGLSPLGAAREVLGAAQAQERFGAKFFSQGGFPSGWVGIEKFLTQDQRDVARSNLQQLLGGVGNAHKWALMEGGMKPTAWQTMPLEDMQFLVSRKFSIQEIARFYRVPPHMLADLERATFSNIEQQSQDFVMFTLMPYFTRIEASVKKWLLAPDERQSMYLRFNYEGLLRADSAARAEFYSKGLQNGWVSRNEVRKKENLNPSDEPGMDDFTVQVNLTSISKLGETPAPQPQLRRASDANLDTTPPKQIEGHTVNVMLPDASKVARTDGEIEALVDVANDVRTSADSASTTMKMIAAAQKRIADQTARQSEDLIKTLRAVITQQQKDIADLKRLVVADRMAIFDEDGMPVGQRVVIPEEVEIKH